MMPSLRASASLALIASALVACVGSAGDPTDADERTGQTTEAMRKCTHDCDEPPGPVAPPPPPPTTFACKSDTMEIVDGVCWNIGCITRTTTGDCAGYTLVSQVYCTGYNSHTACYPLLGYCTCTH